MTKSKAYPTDLKSSEWQALQGLLPTPKATGRPRLDSFRSILNAIFYVVKGGIPWLFRISEMLELAWRDVDPRNGELKVRKGKGKKRRTVPLTNTLKGVLERAKQRGQKPLPYSDRFAASYAFEQVCHAAGVIFQGKALHGLGHYCGTKAYQASKDILRVGKLLGHSDIETTVRYSKLLRTGFDNSYVEEFREILLAEVTFP
jgi:integrase